MVRVSLMDVDPVVWRRLLVPGGIRLARLNERLQCAMGWTNSHLHCFQIGDKRHGMHADEYPDGEIDERSATVVRSIGDHDRFAYEYDFGDSWEHEIVVERVDRLHHGLRSAVCLDGENACPPEDCVGAPGTRRCSRHSRIERILTTTSSLGGSADRSSLVALIWPRSTSGFSVLPGAETSSYGDRAPFPDGLSQPPHTVVRDGADCRLRSLEAQRFLDGPRRALCPPSTKRRECPSFLTTSTSTPTAS